jgi:hypothetical protein
VSGGPSYSVAKEKSPEPAPAAGAMGGDGGYKDDAAGEARFRGEAWGWETLGEVGNARRSC